ncbi:Hypothetical protein A7982_01342 [Minicystis rosea]|nr:Hypothetical protein A7982_01342 [Minicystis rosea]
MTIIDPRFEPLCIDGAPPSGVVEALELVVSAIRSRNVR